MVEYKKKNKFKELQGLVSEEQREEWTEIQNEIVKNAKEENIFEFQIVGPESPNYLSRVGALDLSASQVNPDKVCGCFVICEYPSMKLIHKEIEMFDITVPYVPSYLAFREVPALKTLIDKVKNTLPHIMPQVYLIDGNGIYHTRGCGCATHLGVDYDLVTIGVSKNVFFVDGLSQKYVRGLSDANLHAGGEHINLVGNSGRIWGAAYKSHNEVLRPMIISVGHRIDLDTSLAIVKNCTQSTRVPVPITLADHLSRDKIKEIDGPKNKKKSKRKEPQEKKEKPKASPIKWEEVKDKEEAEYGDQDGEDLITWD